MTVPRLSCLDVLPRGASLYDFPALHFPRHVPKYLPYVRIRRAEMGDLHKSIVSAKPYCDCYFDETTCI